MPLEVNKKMYLPKLSLEGRDSSFDRLIFRLRAHLGKTMPVNKSPFGAILMISSTLNLSEELSSQVVDREGFLC